MPSFFYNLGRRAAPHLAKANWLIKAVSGSEEEKLRAEVDLGTHLATAYRAQVQLDEDPKVLSLIAKVLPRLMGGLPDRRPACHVKVVETTEANALAFPGGFIFVTRRLLELCHFKEDETAFILGHEMGHIVCRHVIDKYMAACASRIITHIPSRTMAGQVVGGFADYLLKQGYSREKEFEADIFGARLLGSAGYDRQAAVRLLDQLCLAVGELGQVERFFASHPAFEDRIRNLQDGYS